MNAVIRNKLLFIFALFFLHGCNILPGLPEMEPGRIQKEEVPREFKVDPVIIPITAWSISNLPKSTYQYRLAANDILSITVWKHPELNLYEQTLNLAPPTQPITAGTPGYLINNRGEIYFPLVGNIKVAGKTISQARTLISQRLQYYLRDPQVLVRVADYRSQRVYVMGEVLKPGFLPLNDQPLSLTGAINLAGNLDPNAADPHYIYVIRGNVARPRIYWLNVSTPSALLMGEHFRLQHNDIVVVSTAPVARWNRFLNQLLPTIQSVWYTKAVVSN